MDFDLSQYTEGLSKRIVRSALTPALWLCCFGPACWVAVYAFSFRPALERLCLPLGIFGGVLFVPTLFGFFYFAFKHPDKLQSEEYRLRQQALAILKKGAARRTVDAAAIVAIANPSLEEAGKPEGEQ